jgi:hypothetical protein
VFNADEAVEVFKEEELEQVSDVEDEFEFEISIIISPRVFFEVAFSKSKALRISLFDTLLDLFLVPFDWYLSPVKLELLGIEAPLQIPKTLSLSSAFIRIYFPSIREV